MGGYRGSVQFSGNFGADTHLELGFQNWYHLHNWSHYVGFPQAISNYTVPSQPFRVDGAFYSSDNNRHTNTGKAFLDNPAVAKASEKKIALIQEDWVYDPSVLVNNARRFLGFTEFTSDGIFSASTGATNPSTINKLVTPVTPTAGNDVRSKFLKQFPYVPYSYSSQHGERAQQLPLADNLIYYKQGYHPSADSDGKSTEWQDAHVTWAGRVAKYKGTEHSLNTARAYILRTGGVISNHDTSINTNLNTYIAALNDGDCLYLSPGRYTISGVPGGRIGMRGDDGSLGVDALMTPFGPKNIMICGNTNDIASVHITYTSGNHAGKPQPIFGPLQTDHSALAFLTFKKIKSTQPDGKKFRNYAVMFQSNGCKAYKVHFDFDGQHQVIFTYGEYSGSFAEVMGKSNQAGARSILTKCVFSNYERWQTEGLYRGGTFFNAILKA